MKPAPRHLPFFAACAMAVAAFGIASLVVPQFGWAIGANAFFLAYLASYAALLPKMTAEWLSRHAASDDMPIWIIFLITILVIIVSVVLLFDTINAKPAADPVERVLTLAAVPLGWLTIHMMAAIHYAHEYWQPNGSGKSGNPRKGFDFPATPRPGGMEFVYFSYVIGMTAQTSDVAVTTSAMRRRVIVHSIVSFFFNTVIVAAAVNIAVSIRN